jgi:hypothetical protein
MSQAGTFDRTTGLRDIETINGNVGGFVGPSIIGNINLYGINGVTVTGDPVTHTLTISVDHLLTGFGTTVGATTADLITFPMGAVPSTYTIEGRVAGFDAATPAGASLKLWGGTRTTGAAGVILNTVDKNVNTEAALVTSDATIVIVGNSFVVRVTGVAGKTINWTATFEYTQAS